MQRITNDNLHTYLLNGENDTVEFKLRVPEHPKIIALLISAFANTKGGSIIFGYDEATKNIVGVNDAQVNNLKSLSMHPSYKKICSVYTIKSNNKVVAVLDVQKSQNDIYIDNIAYIRNGSQTLCKIGNIRSKHLREFIYEIQYKNRNPQNLKALELLNDVSTNPERRILSGTHLYRCRIINDEKDIGNKPPFYGYGKEESFVPPINLSRDMRANYRYIPYLYCANHPYTALVEVRPRLGAKVSVATVQVNEELTLLDFTLKSTSKKITNPKINLFSDLSMLYSKPVSADDNLLDYIPTQFVAEYAKKLGYDGIAFRSSLTPELDDYGIYSENHDRYNIVVFNYHKCEATASNIVSITRNFFDCEQTDSDPNRIIFK